MILTVLANAIVTGIIVYFFQKKFEANLQKSLFEHQTKFSRNYAKQVETLETLYQNYIIYKTDFNNMTLEAMRADFIDEHGKTQLRKLSGFFEERVEQRFKQISTAVSSRIAENGLKFKDFKTYFENNSIFLSPDTCSVIHNILDRYFMMEWAMQIFLDDVPEEFVDNARRYIKELFEIDMKSDLERPEIATLFANLIVRLDDEVNTQAEKLEKLYKSVADTANKEHDE